MKHVFRFPLFLWMTAFFLSGCTSSFDPNPDGTYRVRIAVSDGKGQYHLETVTLKSVTNISSLTSSTVNIRVNGEFVDETKADGSRQMWVKNFGTVPAAHFIKSGDVLIPADYRTFVMASLVYQFESIRDFFEKYHGNEGLSFPRTALLDMKYKHSAESVVAMVENDARYIYGLDMFVIVPYSQGLMPLGLNGGILTHEYFHSILEMRRLEKQKGKLQVDIKEETKSLFCANSYQYAGLNEGIADFFGYNYTKDPDFGSVSYKASDNMGRNLKEFKSVEVDGGDCNTNEHILGTRIAHLLYVISEEWGVDETSKEIFNFINLYEDLYTTDLGKQFIGLKRILPLFFENHRPSEELCQKMEKIIAIPNVFSGYCKAPSTGESNK